MARFFTQMRRLPALAACGLVVFGLILLAVFGGIPGDNSAPPKSSEIAAVKPPVAGTPLPGDPVSELPPVFLPPRPPDDIEKTITVGNGDTFMSVMTKAGAASQDAYLAIEAMRKLFDPRKLRQDQEITVLLRPETRTATTGKLVGFQFDPTVEETIRISLQDDGYTAETHKRILDIQDAAVAGTIESNLYLAAVREGLPPTVLVELIRLLSWDVDFQRDIQKGDRFTVLTERLHRKDGSVARWGDIQYAELIMSGKPVRIYRYETKQHGVEYFDDKGLSAEKALMKTPIDGARLSSRFGRRKHPILGYTRMHKGIDFAAPSGTPIYAAGNGTVVYAGRKGGFGKYIQIRHNGTYATAYAHMKSFARGIRRSSRVRQGQVIGYVGTTGRSTGPHLHYEVHLGGSQVNPLQIKLPSGRKLAGAELRLFSEHRAKIDARLAAVSPHTHFADATQ